MRQARPPTLLVTCENLFLAMSHRCIMGCGPLPDDLQGHGPFATLTLDGASSQELPGPDQHVEARLAGLTRTS